MPDMCTEDVDLDQSRRRACPQDGREYLEVGMRTVLHHLKNPWQKQLPKQRYYFCEASDCDVVYFGEDGLILGQEDLRIEVGQKTKAGDRTLCYCFGVSAEDYRQDASLKSYVSGKTLSGECACAVRNPSGRCCLKDFK